MTDDTLKKRYKELNRQQRRLADVVTTGDPGMWLVNGGPGSGKSATVRYVRDYFASVGRENELKITAASHAAADLIGAECIDSFAGFRVQEIVDKGKVKYVAEPNPAKKNMILERKKWKGIRWLIIDECFMKDCHFMDHLDRYLQRLRGQYRKPFGGIGVVLIGDLFQLPPVRVTPGPLQYLFKWKKFDEYFSRTNHIICFRRQYRFKCELLLKVVNGIRYGKPSEEIMQILQSRVQGIPDDCIYIAPRVAQVERHNLERLENMDGIEETLEATFEYTPPPVGNKRQKAVPATFGADDGRCFRNDDEIRRLAHTRIKRVVKMKKNAPVVVLHKMEGNTDVYNGASAVYLGRHGNTIHLKMNRSNRDIYMPRVTVSAKRPDHGIFSMHQFGVDLEFASTVHSQQGRQIGEGRKICIEGGHFAPGQFYVALTRAETLNQIYLTRVCPADVIADPECVLIEKTWDRVHYQEDELE